MTPATRLDIEVEVRIGDAWLPGFLEHWRKRDGRWEGWVRWTKAPGMHYLDWVDQDDVRKV